MRKTTDLSAFRNHHFKPGGFLKRGIWYLVNFMIFDSAWIPFSYLKVLILRFFGAKVGKHVVIKPNVNIKYPWFLEIGNHTWIGEKVWIDNLGKVSIGDNCCISQGAMLLTGNHNYKKPTFDLVVEPIHLEDGVWVGAQSVVCPGVRCENHSVLTVGSVATRNLKSYSIHQGNPAKSLKSREIH